MLQYLISLINVAAVLKWSTIHFLNSSLLKKIDQLTLLTINTAHIDHVDL